MKVFVVVSSLLAIAAAAPQLLTQRVYTAIPATTIITGPAEVSSQFHAQDEFGQYTYGYNGGLSAKTEAKSLDGVTRGAYSYLDAENKLQTVTYTADAANGFRAEASNLPVAPVETRMAPEPVEDTPEVAQAKVEHMAAVEEIKLRNAVADKADEEEESSVVVNAAPAAAIAPITAYAAAAPAVALAPASGFAYSTHSVALKNEPLAITTYAAPAPAAVEIKTPSSFSYSTYTQTAPAAIQYAAAPAAIQYAAAPAAIQYAAAPAAIQYAAAPAALQYAAAPAAFQYAAAPAATTYSLNVQAPAYAYQYGAPAFYSTSNVAPIAFAARSLPAAEVALPEPVQDTPEVAQAKAEHLQAVADAKARNLQ